MAGLGDMFGASFANVNSSKPRNSDRIEQPVNPMAKAFDAVSGVVKQGYNNAKAGLSDPKVLAGYIRKGLNVDAITKAADWRMAGIDAMTGSSDMPGDVQRAGVEAGMNIAMNAPAITVWHGSPHKFDKFDMSKIGTGEGAQAYGHGLYFAEAPEVAKGYKNALSPGAGIGESDTIVRALQMNGGDSAKAAIDLENRAQYANMPGGKEKLLAMAEKVRNGFDPSGALYKADIPDEAVARFLDWDKPLSQQAPEVQAAISPMFEKAKAEFPNLGGDPMGNVLYNMIGGNVGSQAQIKGAKTLKDVGIPGIRYLDGGSRGTGAGTSNFVVFDDQLPRILEVNGQATGAKPWGAGEWQSALGAAFGGK